MHGDGAASRRHVIHAATCTYGVPGSMSEKGGPYEFLLGIFGVLMNSATYVLQATYSTSTYTAAAHLDLFTPSAHGAKKLAHFQRMAPKNRATTLLQHC